MTQFAYHASHEQFSPSALLNYARLAEAAGFSAVHSSDHFHPWSKRQGQSGFSFTWLGAAMQVTTIPFGVVCSPGQRYHPAIVAQAIATLCELYPGRLWVSLGSGEALNENITGHKWLSKKERNIRLQESVHAIRRLLNGELVNAKGLITIENARLFTLPEQPPLLLGAALSEGTARWMGNMMDGLITAMKPHDELKKIVQAFRSNGGRNKPVYLKVPISYSRNAQEAIDGAYDQWRTNVFEGTVLSELSTVEQFDAAAEFVRNEDLETKVRVSSNIEDHIKWLRKDMELHFDKIILHNVNREQETFIEDFGKNVLPELTR